MADRGFSYMVMLCTMLIVAVFLWILADIAFKGFAHLSLSFFIAAPEDAGRQGGIFPILVSTVLILMVALVVAFPFGLGIAIWLAEFSQRNHKTAATTRLLLDVLSGIPSIVYGLFGNAFFSLFLGLGFSILSGGLTLACMILPIFIHTAEAGLSAVPSGWRSGAAALGMSKTAAVWHILLPAAAPAVAAGLILGTGRASAETAALIFTSGYVDRMPESLMDSGRTLSVHIYDLSMNVTGGDPSAYASALTLLCVIMALNLATQKISQKIIENRILRT